METSEEGKLANRDEETGSEKWIQRFGADPARISALTLLNERSAGAGEVAHGLGLSREEATQHLERMHDLGLIEVVGETRYSGKVEPCYRATEWVRWSDEETASFSLPERQRLLAWIVSTVRADVDEALVSGNFAARENAHASRIVLQVDEQGWDELVRIHVDALDAILDIQATSAERLDEAKATGISALSAVFCTELPPRGEARMNQP